MSEDQAKYGRPGKEMSRVHLGVGNRDGDAYAVKMSNGKCFLVLQADTYHNEEVFAGMGSTEQVEITTAAFTALADDCGAFLNHKPINQ